MKTPEEKVKIIIELIKPYYDDPTKISKKGDSCLYKHPNGNKCAVGKCMIASKYKSEMEGSSILLILSNYTENILKAKYRNIFIPTEWGLIQSLHDNPHVIDYTISQLNNLDIPLKITDIIPINNK